MNPPTRLTAVPTGGPRSSGSSSGRLITLPALVFALEFSTGETLLPVFVPGIDTAPSALRGDVGVARFGAVNVLLTSVLNGLLFAVLFGRHLPAHPASALSAR